MSTNLIKFENQNNIIFLSCSCHNELLCIDYDKELNIADLCIYEKFNTSSYRMSFWQRLRWVCQIMLKKSPYTDQIILNYDQLKELHNFLNLIGVK
jgi:hypothetical protein